MPEEKKIKPWYLRKEVLGTALSTVSGLLMLFPSHTTAYKVGATIGITLGGITGIIGLRKGYQANNLPDGITKVMDAIPDSLTGVKGSSLKYQ